MFKKGLTFLTVVLLLLPFAASCAGGKGEADITTGATTVAPAAETALVESVEKKDYDGASFGFLTIGSSERYCKEILPTEEDESDPIYAAFCSETATWRIISALR